MNCEEIRELLNPLVDEELTREEQYTIREHLEECSECRLQHVQLLELRQTLADVPHYKLPPDLERSLHEQIANASVRNNIKYKPDRWKLFSTHVIAAIVGALIFNVFSLYPEAPEVHNTDIVELHVRSLIDGSLTQILAGDPHDVKPWFAGKLDYSPPVKDLSEHGYPLVGGRVDHLLDRDVAVLVYKFHKHWINVVITPVSFNFPIRGAAHRARNGYHVANASTDSFVFSAISDTHPDELLKFVQYITVFD